MKEPEKNRSCVERRIRILFWLAAIALGALQAWGYRHFMDTDGVSYLDHGDAFFRGEWGIAVNPYWSPLYSWLLGLALFLFKPSPYWEYSVVHLVNFLIYLCALGSFEFFLRQLIQYQESRQEKLAQEGWGILSGRPLQVLGYSLFIWSSLVLITVGEVTPDMMIAAFVYLVCGILLRIRRGRTSWPSFILLGGILAFGYLTKSPMLLLSLVFLATSLLSAGKLKEAWPRTLVAFAVFLLISSPYVITISHTMGRLTFGESGRIHYFWFINQRDLYSDSKIKKIFDVPPVYEFGAPIQGTFPIWFDPAYWYKDVVLNYFDIKGLAQALIPGGKNYYRIFFSFQGYFIACLLLLLYLSRRRWLGIKDMAENWILLLPVAAVLGMYAPLLTNARYLGPFVTLLWMGLFLGIRLRDSHESRRLFNGVTLSLAIMMSFQIAREETSLLVGTIREIVKGEEPTAHPMWRVARHLNRMGIKAGEPVASIGNYYHSLWARLARVRIIAMISRTESSSFWSMSLRVQSQVVQAFASTGAKVLVAERVPLSRPPEGWERIEDTDFFVRSLQKPPS